MFLKRFAWLTLLLALVFATTAAEALTWETNADLRERIQIFDNFNFNDSVNADKWEWDSRLYLQIGAEFRDDLKLFLQPQGVNIYTDLDSGGYTNFSQVDFYQAFIE